MRLKKETKKEQTNKAGNTADLSQLPDLGVRQRLADHVGTSGGVVGLDDTAARGQEFAQGRNGHGGVPVDVRHYAFEYAAFWPYRIRYDRVQEMERREEEGLLRHGLLQCRPWGPALEHATRRKLRAALLFSLYECPAIQLSAREFLTCYCKLFFIVRATGQRLSIKNSYSSTAVQQVPGAAVQSVVQGTLLQKESLIPARRLTPPPT